MSDPQKYVYSFGGGKADGKADIEDAPRRQGGQPGRDGVIGIPVPPIHDHHRGLRRLLRDRQEAPRTGVPEIHAAVKRMEELYGAKFGDPANPLLVSVRSGAAMSMPGMNEHDPHLGLSDARSRAWPRRRATPASPTTVTGA